MPPILNLLARLWCAVVGHRLDDNSVNTDVHVLRHCARCNSDVYERL